MPAFQSRQGTEVSGLFGAGPCEPAVGADSLAVLVVCCELVSEFPRGGLLALKTCGTRDDLISVLRNT
jgi:hypothetical protein